MSTPTGVAIRTPIEPPGSSDWISAPAQSSVTCDATMSIPPVYVHPGSSVALAVRVMRVAASAHETAPDA
ncbi:MAG TPA: hypothetical protein VGI86_21365 [Acidimicrobiia bacterium]